ncbi:hypothetical protein PsorP6_007362 [Peronosclerospora sorghi]|uniref:Uncharacterized protein n=1 Tax=Peronosclerospora sorghi TaxID=230839 RepID=A0ACC0WBF2_9STRA|nr:hypothetical protein PsorP6_007362 [Peronosclerospora sorghi]
MGATTGDIRSFFGAVPAAKKRCTVKDKAAKCSRKDSGTTSEIEGCTENEVQTSTEQQATQGPGDGQVKGDASLVTRFAQLHRMATLRSMMHASWFDLLHQDLAHGSFQALTRFLAAEESRKQTLYPPPADVFAALRDCAFSDLKVVILGQDPYHAPRQAHGLSFSVRPGVPPPPSLKNIFKEARQDVGIPRPSHGCLSSWSQQGVLLLNTVLTVRRGEPHSHKKRGWERFTDAIISKASTNASNVVFLLWGKPAQEKELLIDAKRHLVVRSSHPSPLGATKTNAPFLGSKCFSRANHYLEEHGKEPIDWRVH